MVKIISFNESVHRLVSYELIKQQKESTDRQSNLNIYRFYYWLHVSVL
jgi:hypothetical protein